MIFGPTKMKNKNIINIAKEVIRIETDSLKKLNSTIGKSFEQIIRTILNCKSGKVIISGVGSWRIILGGFLGASITGILFNLWGLNELMSFSWINHLFVGGLAFGIIFMATDPVSAAQTVKGKWIYGILVGIFCILIRVFNPAYPEGVMLAILLMNVFAPTIDHYVVEKNINRRKKRWTLNQIKTA